MMHLGPPNRRDDGRTDQPQSLRRVLVFERYEPLRQTLCSCLTELGLDVIPAATAAEARAIAASTSLDLVISEHDPFDPIHGHVIDELRAGDASLPAVLLVALEVSGVSFPQNSFVLFEMFSLEALEHAVQTMLRVHRPTWTTASQR